ncbi:PepSY domain-containing protein [Burkholderia sp. S171]|uniref:PepSY domain-containing protein n=1 Tax=Burkholderia sp. S171 TaxID=1641860 RepID=UPI0020B13A23|nr:PepSY domain-containing protein [Burkholderia sp. S171]
MGEDQDVRCDTGKALLAFVALFYLLLLASGLVLWWPRSGRPHWRVELRKGTSRALYDLHRVGGATIGPLLRCRWRPAPIQGGFVIREWPLSPKIRVTSHGRLIERLALDATIFPPSSFWTDDGEDHFRAPNVFDCVASDRQACFAVKSLIPKPTKTRPLQRLSASIQRFVPSPL